MQVIALVDCDNFFVSCERVFNPSLIGKPVVVLSNNDGCIISRSEEAKKLGLTMDPYFKVKDYCKHNNVRVFSSNFTLYGDMSSRVMAILQDFSPEIEIYSIDEAFVNLSHIPSSRLEEVAREIKAKILKDTGIPVSIGISSTKSLAKVAQNIAKKNKQAGIYSLLTEAEQTKVLSITSCSEIWGVGRNLSRTLEELGIENALQFRDMDTALVRKYLKLSGQKLQHELKGIPCFEIEQVQEARKNITVSRSFSKPVSELEEMENVISEFVARAAVKLRKQDSVCESVCVYIRTGVYDYNNKYSNNTIEYFPLASNDTAIMISAAKKALHRIFKKGYNFKKAGVILLNLSKDKNKQLSLYESKTTDRSALLNIIDKVNNKLGNNTIFYLAQGISQKWKGKNNFCSQNYTTNWAEILKVK